MDYEQVRKLIRQHIPEPDATAICSWLSTIIGDSAKERVPECPNCSLPGRPFLMRPIPADFVMIENATHECSKCGFKSHQPEI